jgi:3-hydroxyacyl-CoA dehydrogenase/enoyl-CoA hydratase/3-hydroxybutyryl-CoA epimerase
MTSSATMKVESARSTAEVPGAASAPPAGSCVRIQRPEPGLAVLVLEPPHRNPTVLDLPLMRDLQTAVRELAQHGDLTGLVLTGRSPLSFAVGADLDALARLDSAATATELARFGQQVFSELAALQAFKVAAVGGPVPGGAFELALACDRIVLAEHKSSRIGLPETQLGILPGWGGCQRLPRRVGVPKALEAILTGKLFPPRPALSRGLVDRLAWPEYLLRVASDVAMGRERLRARERGAWVWLVDKNPLAKSVIARRALAGLRAKTRGHYPAPEEALRLVVAAPSTPIERGLENEARALGTLAVSSTCKNLVRVFRLSEEAKKLARDADGKEAPALQRAGVVGAGVMGAAIAGLMAERGVAARLADLSVQALDAAVKGHRARVAKALGKRILSASEARASIDRLETSSATLGFGQCELVVEAVAEKLEIKRKVLGALAAQMKPGAVLATNTSSLSVETLARELEHPERVVGMHFFNPVHQMPLVEIVRGKKTSDEAVRRTAKLALQLGKTPVVVADVPGFLVNRILGPYLDEAVRLVDLGLPPERIDKLALDFGLPMGPLELIDEVGLDIAAHAAESLHKGYGARMEPCALAAKLLEGGAKGKKNGLGFYRYRIDAQSGRAAKHGVNETLERARSAPRASQPEVPDSGVLDQLVLALLNEAARALDEAVVASARELDLASVFGMGFAPFRGGVLRYADERGAREIVAALRRLLEVPEIRSRGPSRERFSPCSRLLAMAETGARFHAE